MLPKLSNSPRVNGTASKRLIDDFANGTDSRLVLAVLEPSQEITMQVQLEFMIYREGGTHYLYYEKTTRRPGSCTVSGPWVYCRLADDFTEAAYKAIRIADKQANSLTDKVTVTRNFLFI